ncbi:MAG: cation transporter [Deltaproteobacteria bacterium]|nr:cation transporter [Deltaproteobacteria bacterium]
MKRKFNAATLPFALFTLTTLLLIGGMSCAAKTANQDTHPCKHHKSEAHKCKHAGGHGQLFGGNIPEGMEVRVYEVFGMDCPGCHGGLEKLIEQIPGVEQAEANWEKKRVAVMVRKGTKLNDEDVYDAIKRANFTPGKKVQ